MKFGVVVFPGSNCDYDAYTAIRDVLRQDVHPERNTEQRESYCVQTLVFDRTCRSVAETDIHDEGCHCLHAMQWIQRHRR